MPMHQNMSPAEGRVLDMGFQTSDLRPFCHRLLTLAGVTGVWLLRGPSDRDGMIYVTVAGFNPEAHQRRLNAIREVERYRMDKREAMVASEFIFDYAVLVDDSDLGEPHIPAGAELISAA